MPRTPNPVALALRVFGITNRQVSVRVQRFSLGATYIANMRDSRVPISYVKAALASVSRNACTYIYLDGKGMEDLKDRKRNLFESIPGEVTSKGEARREFLAFGVEMVATATHSRIYPGAILVSIEMKGGGATSQSNIRHDSSFLSGVCWLVWEVARAA